MAKPLAYRMPSCTDSDQAPILAAIGRMQGSGRRQADDLLEGLGPKQLCVVLHSMRRWYSSQSHTSAQNLLRHRETLSSIMDLRPLAMVGSWRGFKVDSRMPLAGVDPGDVIVLPVERNRCCSSWTLQEKFAHRFSGRSRGKVGIVVRLAVPDRCVPFIAPPCRTDDWFNRLYASTMGRSFRFNEQEYAAYGTDLIVEVMRVKR